MKCLETESLISYAYRLVDEPAASEVRGHIAECSRCRAVVEQYGRLDAVLSEWTAAEPGAGFDARVRQSIESEQARRASWSFWSWQWARQLGMVAAGILVVVGVSWLAHFHRGTIRNSPVAMRQQPTGGAQTPPPAGLIPAQRAPKPGTAGAASMDDKDAQAMEDYDLAANFDLLSEIPKGGARVAN